MCFLLSVVLQATGDQRIKQFMIQGRKAFPTRSTEDDPIGFFSQSAGTKEICSSFTGVGIKFTIGNIRNINFIYQLIYKI